MLSTDNILETLLELIKVTDSFGGLLFHWNCSQQIFQLKSKRKQLLYKVRFLITVIFTLLVLLQILLTWKATNVFVKLHSVFLFCSLLVFMCTHFVFCSNAQLIVAYLNGMLVMEKSQICK